jgi:hypothetical protein
MCVKMQIIENDKSCDVSQGPTLQPDVPGNVNNNCMILFLFAHPNRGMTIGVLV